MTIPAVLRGLRAISFTVWLDELGFMIIMEPPAVIA